MVLLFYIIHHWRYIFVFVGLRAVRAMINNCDCVIEVHDSRVSFVCALNDLISDYLIFNIWNRLIVCVAVVTYCMVLQGSES